MATENLMAQAAGTLLPAEVTDLAEVEHRNNLPIVSPPASKPQATALQKIISERDAAVAESRTVKVLDSSTFAIAASYRQSLRAVKDGFEALLRPGIARAHESHQAALAELKRYIQTVEVEEARLKKEQDVWQTEQKRLAREEQARVQRMLEEAREKALEQQLIQAAKEEDTSQVSQVLERMAQPAPVIPSTFIPTRAQGAQSREVWTWKLLDIQKLDMKWVKAQIVQEIMDKGSCELLDKMIKREVGRLGKGAEVMVGKGSILVEEEVSTGVRRRT